MKSLRMSSILAIAFTAIPALPAAGQQSPRPLIPILDAAGIFKACAEGIARSREALARTKAETERTTATDIIAWLESRRAMFDVDGDGKTAALTDGLLILRYLFGLRGAELVNHAVGSGATRAAAPLIESYLSTLMP